MTNLIYHGEDGVALFACRLEDRDRRAGDDRRVVVLLHGGGPDHESLIPLGEALPLKQISAGTSAPARR